MSQVCQGLAVVVLKSDGPCYSRKGQEEARGEVGAPFNEVTLCLWLEYKGIFQLKGHTIHQEGDPLQFQTICPAKGNNPSETLAKV